MAEVGLSAIIRAVSRNVARTAVREAWSFNRAWNEVKNLNLDITYRSFQSTFREVKKAVLQPALLRKLPLSELIPIREMTPVSKNLPKKYHYRVSYTYTDEATGQRKDSFVDVYRARNQRPESILASARRVLENPQSWKRKTSPIKVDVSNLSLSFAEYADGSSL